MASCLSEVEFERLQKQLLELRESNYSLEGKCRRHEQERIQFQEQINQLDKELTKHQKIIARSKKAREIEALIQENENLQRKLEFQEEEFKLQNATLMQELSSVLANNESLERQLQASSNISHTLSDDQAELTRLRAENAALQKSLQQSEEKFENALSRLKNSSITDEDEKDLNQVAPRENLQHELHNALLKLTIETEEKQQWKEQAISLEKKLTEEIIKLKEDNAKLTEKIKKKQESYQAIQEEKENFYVESKKSLENLRNSLENQISHLNDQNQKLQSRVNTLITERDKANELVCQLQASLAAAQCQAQNGLLVEELQTEKASLEIVLQELRADLENFQKENQALKIASEEMKQSLAQLQQEKNQLLEEKEAAQQTAAEASKVAEKRKQLLDEMAIRLQETIDQHKSLVTSLAEEHAQQIQTLQAQLVEIRGHVGELEKLRSTTLELGRQLEAKQGVEAELAEMEQRLAARQTDWEEEMARAEAGHKAHVAALTADWNTLRQDLEARLEQSFADRATLEEEISKLKQELKDAAEERKIHDKKSLAMVKELRKQLQGERRHNEKLQERIQELLNNSPSAAHSQNQAEEIIPTGVSALIHHRGSATAGDTSSISSWSFMSGFNNHLDNSAPEANACSDNNSASSVTPDQSPLEQETSALLARIAAIQQEKWILEEKLDHLETSNAAMAQDLMEKSAIIQHYCMESNKPLLHPASSHAQQDHDSKPTMKRLVDYVKDKATPQADDSIRDMNRRLQRMLEETLTKNMHLQKDLEQLSLELVQLKNKSSS